MIKASDSDSTPKTGMLGGPAGLGASGSGSQGISHSLRAFRHRNFKIFFWGALVSNSGNWLQNATIPFVLFEITGSAKWVGFAAFSQFIPLMILGPLGGSIADRFDRRRVLVLTQSGAAAVAALLWGLWASGVTNPWIIMAVVALSGTVAGIAIPSWQAFVPSLVPQSDLNSAITLNSLQFNAARAIGPLTAGALLATIGASAAFLINAVTYAAVIGAIIAVKVPSTRTDKPKQGVLSEFKTALTYINSQPGIKVGILVATLIAILGNPVIQFTAVFAKDVYDVGDVGFGMLAGSLGIGAIIAAPFITGWDRVVPRSTMVRWALPIYALSIIAAGLSQQLWVGILSLVVAGGGFLAAISTTNTAVQIIVSDRMRGRVMAARVMAFTGGFPMGSLIQGALADRYGVGPTVTVAGSLLLILALALATRPDLLAHLDDEPDT